LPSSTLQTSTLSVAVQFMSAGPADPVLDFETKAPRLDANGQPIYSVPLFAISPDSYDTLTVKVAGEPRGVGNFTPVKVTNLIASTWDVGGNHGISFRADKIELAKAAANCVPIPLEESSGCDRLRRGRAACRRVARRLPTCRRNARPRASTTGAFIFWRAFVLFPRTVLLNCRFFQWLDYQP
jgi:hypothetical protein